MAQSDASVGVKPNQGPPGSSFTISWSGFSDCSGPATFTWDGAPLATGSQTFYGTVGASVPSGAAPGRHLVAGGCRGRTFNPSTVFLVTPPVTTTTRPTTTRPTRPTTTRTRPPVTTTTQPPPVSTTTTTPTTTTTTTTSAPSTSSAAPSTSPLQPVGRLTFDHAQSTPGDPLAASGQGCQPGATVVLRSDGQVIGRAVADDTGRFTAPLEFHTIQGGRHDVLADCGIQLTGSVDQVVTSSQGGATTGTLLVLVFFVLAGVGLVRMR